MDNISASDEINVGKSISEREKGRAIHTYIYIHMHEADSLRLRRDTERI